MSSQSSGTDRMGPSMLFPSQWEGGYKDPGPDGLLAPEAPGLQEVLEDHPSWAVVPMLRSNPHPGRTPSPASISTDVKLNSAGPAPSSHQHNKMLSQ